VKRCIDLTDDQIAAALVSREATGELLATMAKIARPNEGAAKILIPLARAAKEKCAWLSGPLLVQITPVGEKTEVRIAADRGGGVLVAVFEKLIVGAPFSEFERGLKTAPRVVEPLRVFLQPDKIVLAPNRRMSEHRLPAILELARKSPVLDFSALEDTSRKKS
jgi:hypothetical protein